MKSFERVTIKGFRRLFDVSLEMRPLMVLIGANGVGKTSILDAFSLLAASASGNLNKKLGELGGLSEILTGDKANGLSLAAEMNTPGFNPLTYDLSLELRGTTYAVSSETLTQVRQGHENDGPFMHIDSRYNDIKYYEVDERRLLRPNWNHNPYETSLSQVPKTFRQPEELRHVLGSAVLYHVLDVGQRAPVKLPQQMKPAEMPGESGEDLVPFLYSLRESDPERYQIVEDTMRTAFQTFEAFGFPSTAAGMLALTWKDRNIRRPFYAHQLSEGTLRFLWLVSLLFSPGLPTVTMIDEPEVSLHPELLSLLADLLREASRRSQIIVTTHSDRLVRFLKPEEVVVMDLDEDGNAQATWADTLNLDDWLDEYTLDEVWRMGRMGARS